MSRVRATPWTRPGGEFLDVVKAGLLNLLKRFPDHPLAGRSFEVIAAGGECELLVRFDDGSHGRVQWMRRDESPAFRPVGGNTGEPLPTLVPSGLDDSVHAFRDQLVDVHTAYGWGWTGNPGAPAPPPPFHARIKQLSSHGGVAVIETPGHPLNDARVSFSLRHLGVFNFTDNPGAYDVAIADEKGCFCSGYAMITAPQK